MAQPQPKYNASSNAGRVMRFAFILMVAWCNCGLVAIAPVLKFMIIEAVAAATPFEVESEPFTESADNLEDAGEVRCTRRAATSSNRNLTPLLLRICMDQATVSLVHDSDSPLEFELRNGCGATLRC